MTITQKLTDIYDNGTGTQVAAAFVVTWVVAMTVVAAIATAWVNHPLIGVAATLAATACLYKHATNENIRS